MDSSLTEILTATANQNNLLASNVDKITNIYTQAAGKGEVAAESARAAGESAAIVASARELGLLTAQQNTTKAALALGTKMDDASEIVTSVAADMRDSYNRARADLETIRANQSISVAEDPLGWLGVQLGAGDDAIAAYNANKNIYEASSSHLSAINALTTQSAQTQAAIAETRTAASVEAAAKGLKAETDAKVAAIEQQNLLLNVQGLKTVNDMNQQQLSNLYHQRQAVQNEKMFAMQQESHALAVKEAKVRLAKAEEGGDDDSVVRWAQQGMAALTGGTAPLLPKKDVLRLIAMKEPMYAQALAIGARLDMTGKLSISPNVGEAATIIASTKAELPAGMAPVKGLLTTALSSTLSGKGGAPVDTKDARAVAERTSTFVKLEVNRMLGNINTSDPKANIYAPPPLRSIADNSPAVRDSALFSIILSPQVQNGMIDFEPNKIVQLAIAGVKDKKISLEDAVAGITTLSRAAGEINNTTRQYEAVGLPTQTSFNVKLDRANNVVPANVNLMNDVSVSNEISRQLAAARIRDVQATRMQNQPWRNP